MATLLYFFATYIYISTCFAETVTINPGDNIQSAIDKVHSAGGAGKVIFNKGTYYVNHSVKVYSDITLQGNPDNEPEEIILTPYPNNLKFNQPIITTTNSNGGMKNINIIGLSLVGNIQPSEQNYPPYCLQCSKNCTGKKPSDPGCSCLTVCGSARTGQNGASFPGGGGSIDTATNENLLLENLRVHQNAMGLTASGWKNLRVKNCETFGNGMIQEYFHNIYFRRNFNITISGLKSHDSPTGNGINMSQSSYIVAFLSIFENNYWRGLRIEGEEGYVFHNIHVYNNTCDGDGDYGFRFANGYDGIVENNVAKNNTPTNCYKANLKNITFVNNQGF